MAQDQNIEKATPSITISVSVPFRSDQDPAAVSEITAPLIKNLATSNGNNAASTTELKAKKPVLSAPTINSVQKHDITFEDYLSFRSLSFTWAESYDLKDFTLLATIIAPDLHIDYSLVGPTLPKIDRMPAADFLAFVSSPHFLGSPLIRTQHLLGTSRFERLSENEAKGYWQIRAAHQRYDSTGTVEWKGMGHAMIEHWYSREEGREWKLAGLKPNVRWNEGHFENIFRDPE